MNQQPEFEFLVSTMHRTNLSFLEAMFIHFDISTIHVLVINQTTKDKIVESNNPNIRVINVFEKGLSRSRNLAIKNAVGNICFIADDDLVYLPNCLKIVQQAYQEYPDAALISFQYLREDHKIYKSYQKKPSYQNHLLHKQVLTSMEITFKSSIIKHNDLKFNTCFGFGKRFQWFEETVFRDDVIRNRMKVAFVPEPIVMHFGKTSVPPEDSKEYTQALVALKYLVHKNCIYLWLLRYIWLLLKRKVIQKEKIIQIWQYGVEAVQDYKRCNSNQK